LKFDNVLNDQRQVIFAQRKNIINNVSANKYAEDFLDEIIKSLIVKKQQYKINQKGIDLEIKLGTLLGKSVNQDDVKNFIKLSDDKFSEKIKEIFLNNREEKIKLIGEKQSQEIEKRILLQLIDQNWKNHIQYLEQLRQVIGLRSYGQRDPLIEYKKEAFVLFESLLDKLKYDYITILSNLKIVEQKQEKVESNNENISMPKSDPKYIGKKMGRNEPCFCGSNKKYKHCCGRYD